jgi:hypothetical protein
MPEMASQPHITEIFWLSIGRSILRKTINVTIASLAI